MLERLDAVAQPGGLLVAEALGQVRQPRSQARQRAALEEALELLFGARGERSRCKRRFPPAADGAEVGRGLRDDEVVTAALQVDTVLLSAATGVGRRLKLSNQPQLLERGLERRPLAFAPEVGAQARAQVTRSPDVEHLFMAVAKEVDTGPSRSSLRERSLVVDPTLPRRGERAKVGEPPCAELLGEPDQMNQHLGGGLCIGEGTVARSGRNAEEVRERGEPDTA